MGTRRRRTGDLTFVRACWDEKQAGKTANEIAKKHRCSAATVHRAWRDYRLAADKLSIEHPLPKDPKTLSMELQFCLGNSADAFEMFYNRYNSEYRLPPHAKKLVEQALKRKRKIINVPPGHMKSTVFSIWFPIWQVCKNRNIQLLIISKTATLAIAFAQSIAVELTSNEKLINDFGIFKPLSENDTWQPGSGRLSIEGRNRSLAHGATIEARGAGQQVYGFRADRIIADDMADIETCLTEDKRKKLSDWFHTILNSRLRPGGEMDVIGTRFHPQDIYGELAAKKITRGEDSEPLYEHVNFPALRDPVTGAPTSDWENGRALWPRVWSKVRLKEDIYEVVGSIVWNQTYQQIPLAADDALAIPEWIYGRSGHKGCLDEDRHIGRGASGEGVVRVLSIDPSPKRFTAMVLADVRQLDGGAHEIVIVDMVRKASLGQRELFMEADRLITEHGSVRYLIFEVNSFARWFVQDETLVDWARGKSIRVIGHTTGRNKTDPELGVTGLSAEFEYGRIRLPYADLMAKELSGLLIREATEYSLTAGKGSTDDLVMALWFIFHNRFRLIPTKGSGLFKNGFKIPPRLKDGFTFQRRAKVPA